MKQKLQPHAGPPVLTEGNQEGGVLHPLLPPKPSSCSALGAALRSGRAELLPGCPSPKAFYSTGTCPTLVGPRRGSARFHLLVGGGCCGVELEISEWQYADRRREKQSVHQNTLCYCKQSNGKLKTSTGNYAKSTTTPQLGNKAPVASSREPLIAMLRFCNAKFSKTLMG